MRDIILSFLNTLDFEIEDEHLEPFIQYALNYYFDIEPKYEDDDFRPPKYFKTLIFLMDKTMYPHMFNKEKI